VSAHLFDRLRELQGRHPHLVEDVRGAGVLAALALSTDAAPIVNAALDRGLLINRTATTVVRLLPPYIATAGDVDEAIDTLDDLLKGARP
jgi:acetylornithine/succinyldiaminopimelate/putrescine aminotransferase